MGYYTGLIRDGLLVNKKRDGGYVPFRKINAYIRSLDVDRNGRLNLRRTSITADILKERFSDTRISELIEFQEFMDADYFIFIQTLCHTSDPIYAYGSEIWVPHSCIHLDKIPGYIIRAESKRFLEILANSSGCSKPDLFVDKLKISSDLVHKMWPYGFYHGPLAYYNFEKLGTWP